MARPGRGGLGRDRPGGDGPDQRGAGPTPGDPQRRGVAAAGAGLRPGRAVAAHGPWLGEVAGALLRRAAAAPPPQGPLPGRRLRIADGSMITGPGGKRKWRLHAAFDPVAGRFTDLALTDERGAESFGRTTWQAGGVALGDRCYARPPALRQLLATGADFIVRTGWTRLRLLDADRAPPAWERIFGDLAVGEVAERAVSVDYSGKGGKSRGDAVFPARLIVLRLAPETAARAAKAQHRRQNRCRLRRQVELAFKRLKSLLGLDRLPAKSAALARSWLFAHLIMALLIEDTARKLLDLPPWADAPTLHLTLARHADPA